MADAGRLGMGAILLSALLAGSARAQPNPYCVAGGNWNLGGVMATLGMPGGPADENGSMVYSWGQYDNLVVMPSPCHITYPSAFCYDKDLDTIPDQAGLEAWVAGHPGRFWLIGNEPNGLESMTPAEYARMFHAYHVVVKGIDSTAHLAVAGLGGSATPDDLAAHLSYWDQVLAEYRSQYGEAMPIDIWNAHPYVMVGFLDPDRVIGDYVLPFRDYVDSVENGTYAGTELWLTEIGVATWITPLSPTYVNEFMEQIGPHLEASGVVDRFFWFVGPWASWDLSLADVCLIGPEGQPTLIGQTYSSMANSVPNPIPPPAPSQQPFPTPPVQITNDFETDAVPWQVLSGDWVIDTGGYRQNRHYGPCGTSAFLPYHYRDVRVEFDLKINASTNNGPLNWGGVTLRGGWIWDEQDFWHTMTYLVFLRKNGELGLHTAEDGTVRTIPNAVADTSVYHRIVVTLMGSHLHVDLDGTRVIEWDDVHTRRSTGLVYLRCCKSDSTFDNVVVTELRPCDFDHDGDVDQSDFGHMQACLSGPGVAQTNPACADARLDSDTDVDWNDVGKFFRCRTAPGVPSDRSCLDP